MANDNNKAFDAMNAITEAEEVDLTEDGEVSAWFPEGKFLGKKIPKGTAAIVEGLVFLGAGSPGKKVISSVANKIKAKAASLSPEMHGAAIMKASDYMKRVENINRKLGVAGEEGRAAGQKVFELAAREAPKGLARSRVLAEIAKDKAVLDFGRRMGTNIPSAVRNVAQRAQPIGRGTFADVKLAPKAMKSFSKAKRMEDFAREWQRLGGLTAERQVGLGRQYAPAFEALGKFSIPMLVDELGE